MMKQFIILLSIFAICVACSKRATIESDELQEAIAQVWLDADQAQKALG